MNKSKAIDQAYRIATLTEPTEEVRGLLWPLEFERALELLLMLRMSTRPVRNPAGFLRWAIAEGWTPATLPQKIDRKTENAEVRYHTRRGMTDDQARQEVIENRNKGIW